MNTKETVSRIPLINEKAFEYENFAVSMVFTIIVTGKIHTFLTYWYF